MQDNGLPVHRTAVSLLLLCGVAATAAGVTWAGTRALGSSRALPIVDQAVMPERSPAVVGRGAGAWEADGDVRPPLSASAALLLDGRTPGGYETAAGDDWRGYRSVDDLRAAGDFWWFRQEDVYRWVRLVPDPRYGQVARIVFAASAEPGFAPHMTVRLPVPLDRMWFRWRMRFSPGWTTEGPNPPGHANSYKVAFWLWEGYDGRGQVEISNTDQYVPGLAAGRGGTWLPWRERPLPGSGDFGRVTTEWTDGQWWEFVALYERLGDQRARQHWWRRRLSPDPGAWTYAGTEVEGAPVPRVRAVTLGANRNKSTPRQMHIDWGPWEVVDGTRWPDPFGMPDIP